MAAIYPVSPTQLRARKKTAVCRQYLRQTVNKATFTRERFTWNQLKRCRVNSCETKPVYTGTVLKQATLSKRSHKTTTLPKVEQNENVAVLVSCKHIKLSKTAVSTTGDTKIVCLPVPDQLLIQRRKHSAQVGLQEIFCIETGITTQCLLFWKCQN